jgi:hypothetical protein
MDEPNTENTYGSVSMQVDEDAVPLCPNCLEPCDPFANYCPNCGSNEVINPLASYMPFVDLRFRIGMFGKLWRKTWAPDTQRIDRGINILLLLLFCPLILLIGLPFVICEKVKCRNKHSEEHHID